jgi:hypothetical protein
MEIDKREYLLLLLSKEASEVIQRATKMIITGDDDDEQSMFGTKLGNRSKLQKELGGLLAVIGLLQDNGIIDGSEVDYYIDETTDKLRNKEETSFLF